jgi:mono/diheme cytochrome c family protein
MKKGLSVTLARAAVRLASAGLLVLCFHASASALEPRAQRGYQFAITNCSRCHAIGKVGESPLRIAPPFRTLHERYPIDDLGEAFAEGIVTGHPSMPQFKLDGAQIDDLLAYLKTL